MLAPMVALELPALTVSSRRRRRRSSSSSNNDYYD